MPSPWLAVEAGTDLLARARQIQRSWESLLGGGALDPELPPQAGAELRPTIVESWQRSLATGLDPTDLLPSIEADPSETREQWLEHPLGSLRHVLAEQLQMLAEESNSLVQVTDASGLTLHLDGPEWLKDRAAQMNLVEGARCSETVNGTNGVGTALAADHPVQVFAFEHFSHHHREWVCSGAPIHDPLSRRLVGVIDLSSPWKIAHPRSLELVTTAARTMEQCLLETRRDQDGRLRRRYGDLTTKSTDLLVNPEGYVLIGDDLAHSKPLDVPESGGEIAMHDGSLAVAEPLGHGEAYLIRRPAPPRARAARAEAPERAEGRAHEEAREHAALRHLRELAEEQAALRRVATLVARESTPDRLVAVVAEQVAHVFDVPLVRLIRYEPNGSVVVGGFSEGDDEPFPIGSRWQLDTPGLMATIRQTGRPARVEDFAQTPGDGAAVVRAAGMRSAVGSPIVVGGRVWGAIVLLSPRRASLPENTGPRLADFTELVATAIANAESRAALSQLADEQAALRRVATLVARGVRPVEIFSAVSNEVVTLFGAEMAAVHRFETDGSAVVVVGYSEGYRGVSIGTRWELEDSMAATVVYHTRRTARKEQSRRLDRPDPDVESVERTTVSTVAAPIVVEGHLWGVIGVSDSRGRLPADTEDRLEKFTELVATAIANTESRSELAASRARVIAASDDARRRIERDLHDGAQQQLVTLSVALRSAEMKIPAELDELRADVSRVAEGLTDAVVDLREISRGIHPAILTEGGLVPALRALSRRSEIRVQLDLRYEERLPNQIEVAAYYIVSEAFTNASKHARATRICVSLRVEQQQLHLSIWDDGVGGADPARGSGLIGLKDRVAALGGTIDVRSPSGAGTTIDVEIPVTGGDGKATD